MAEAAAAAALAVTIFVAAAHFRTLPVLGAVLAFLGKGQTARQACAGLANLMVVPVELVARVLAALGHRMAAVAGLAFTVHQEIQAATALSASSGRAQPVNSRQPALGINNA